MAHTASLLREDLEALEDLAGRVVRRRGREVVVPLDALEGLTPALQRHAVRRAYAALTSGEGFLDSVSVRGVLDLTGRTGGTRLFHLPDEVIAAIRSGDELALYRKMDQFPGEEDLLPGKRNFGGWCIEAREVRGYDPEDAARPEVAYLDASRGPYRVRMAREGDAMRPLGLGGTKKVYRAMMDRKVPKDLRPQTPVVVDGRGRVAWIFMGELGEEFRVRTTTEALRVEVERTT